ncbi:electron transfer flavoprotein subunit beta/FixA family protein [Pseudomonas citronellolis]|uniref:electron transfer flavoprotein subunit beta/FixA family protein n=1 Tax=Pseudomonas citronellolis TaxID=53408 RepID=UPI000778B845|nr:electron transfer flavoprotein subunit beta [Pseudomonas citronellolis]AMO75991.1 Electron transfer flavoprotein subunit beta [Pseudomonas citronellolis]
MKILILLAGVADIRFPLHPLSLDDGAVVEGAGARRLLSPFDEAALEVALKLRDAHPETRLEVLVLGGANADNLMRVVAAFKPDRLQRLDLLPACLWDAPLTASQLASVLVREGSDAELVLIGREFGDLDDGGVPVLLASRLGRPLFALAQHAEWVGERVRLLRERGAREEWLTVAAPLLASVTNDKRNKLRHPLMKNVMEAKRLSFDGVTAEVPAVPLALIELAAARAVQRGGDCRLLEGTAPVQARALLDWLKAQGVNP